MKRVGFTLIELLVVIAIIAVLAAILFPVFAKAQQKAKASTCLSNIKQIGLGVIMYCSDWDGYGPTNVAPGNTWWYFGVAPYVKNDNIWVCSKETYGDTTYSMPQWRTEWTAMWSPTSAPDPAKNMLVGESCYRGYGRWEWMKHPHDMAFSWGPDRFGGVIHPEYAGHLEGNNVAYMDGHAKWVNVNKWVKEFDLYDSNSGWYNY